MAATEKKLGASGVLYTDRRDFYVSPNVVKELWTDVAPFTTVISNKETRKVPDPIFKMFEHRNPWVKQLFLCNGDTDNLDSDNTTNTTVTVDGASNCSIDDSLIGMICEVWTDGYGTKKGIVRVDSVTSSTVVVVNTLWTSTGSDIALADDDIFLIIGNAQGEGTTSPEAWADELEVVWNSTQIFKTPLQITGTLLAASLRGESSELARLRAQKNQEHKMQKEKAFLFGKRVGGTGLDLQDGSTSDSFADGGVLDSDGNLVRTTYGIVSAIETYGSSSSSVDYTNIFTVSEASYTYSSFVDDMEKVFQYVPEAGVKRAFVGAGALGYWSKMAGTTGMAGNSGWTVNLSDMRRDSLGFNYKILETPHGILQLIPTPALRGPYNKYMLVVSDENLFHAQYRSSMYQTNIKTDNAFDGVKDQYMSDEGVGISLIESHHLFKITD
tara:strand:- start:3736 stop:5058 length:1323 start_codon:yes stop_codon:yes gene_type:complete